MTPLIHKIVGDPARVARRAAALARIGGRGTAVTRLGLSDEERRAHALVGDWLRRLGATVGRDEAANVVGRFGGMGASVVIGSHLDSVTEGGRYDGALGVVVAVEAMDALARARVRLRKPVEVVGWTDEEGVRFGIGLFGSAAAFGRLPPRAAGRADRDGISIREALRAMGLSGDPRKARIRSGTVRAYIEPHIEQGPRLADARIPLAVVSSIVGILHGRVTVRGRQDHAGTTPMGQRADAFAGAAEMALALERGAAARAGAVGTVGEIAARPGAKNVVPGECTFSIDVRAPAQRTLDAVVRDLRSSVARIAKRRGLEASIDVLNAVPVAPMDRRLRALLRRSCAAAGVDAPDLISGAGHDAENAQLAGVPTGMIFIRSRGGSHSPREDADPRDAARAATALAYAIRELCA
ncbi:MAG: M20 family metallo-hydrolase [Chloroflexi bacterium]|nr:M20 family metallo-hydrolase [Chloroflexota bacterium]